MSKVSSSSLFGVVFVLVVGVGRVRCLLVCCWLCCRSRMGMTLNVQKSARSLMPKPENQIPIMRVPQRFRSFSSSRSFSPFPLVSFPTSFAISCPPKLQPPYNLHTTSISHQRNPPTDHIFTRHHYHLPGPSINVFHKIKLCRRNSLTISHTNSVPLERCDPGISRDQSTSEPKSEKTVPDPITQKIVKS